MRQEIKLGIVIVIFLIIAFFITTTIESSDQATIQKWAKDNSHVIVMSERCYFSVGPYWFCKNTRIYKVDVENTKTYWFRFGLLGTDIEEY